MVRGVVYDSDHHAWDRNLLHCRSVVWLLMTQLVKMSKSTGNAIGDERPCFQCGK